MTQVHGSPIATASTLDGERFFVRLAHKKAYAKGIDVILNGFNPRAARLRIAAK